MAQILDNWGSRNAWIEVQHIFEDKKGKILDIACGTGKVIEILSKNKHLDIYGCDISSFLIDKAKKKNIDNNKYELIIYEKISLKLLLRNINPAGGLCNGTRLIIKNIFSRLIEAEIAVGEKKRNYCVHTKNGTLTIRY